MNMTKWCLLQIMKSLPNLNLVENITKEEVAKRRTKIGLG